MGIRKMIAICSNQINVNLFLVQALLLSRVKNSETLVNLGEFLALLPTSHSAELIDLIHSFSGLFSNTPGRTHLIEHDIQVGNAKPIKQRFYQVNADKLKCLNSEIAYMLENSIAEPSSSSWASPCLLVPKSDGTLRFYTDFRKVNANTKPDQFLLPRIEDCVDQVGSAKFVSKLDLLKGYWQVPLSDRAQEIATV